MGNRHAGRKAPHIFRRSAGSFPFNLAARGSGRNPIDTIQIVPGLETQVMYVRGVGPRVAEMLAAKDIQTAEDLLYHLPFRYEDRQNPRSLDELKPGEMASVIAEVRGAALLRTRRMPIFEMTLGQGRLALNACGSTGPT
jgi:hypothetical protein